MLRSIGLLILCFFFSSLLRAQPEWVVNDGKSTAFSETEYLTGFAITSSNNHDVNTDLRKLATLNARINLAEKVQLSVRSENYSRKSESGEVYNELFNSSASTYSSVDLEGVRAEPVWFDEEKKIYYAFVYVNKQSIDNTYSHKIKRLKELITDRYSLGGKYESQGKRNEALEQYLLCVSNLIELKENEAVLRSVNSGSGVLNEGFAVNETAVEEAVNRTLDKPLTSIDDLSVFICYSLQRQIAAPAPVIVHPFTYSDSKMGGTFCTFLKSLIEKQLTASGKFKVIQYQAGVHAPEKKPENLSLTGYYIEQGSKLKFISNIVSDKESRILASTIAELDSGILTGQQFTIKPANFNAASNDIDVFGKNELLPGGLSIRVWTNKGSDNVFFSKGEKMQVYVQTNLPCFLRFVYHLADGKRAMLLKNYFIDESNVNVPYKIPYEFECAAPFGAEILQVFGSTVKFDDVNTTEINGYEILNEDLAGFISRTRGFKKQSGSLQTEARLILTTTEY